jgi:hypothetical protein
MLVMDEDGPDGHPDNAQVEPDTPVLDIPPFTRFFVFSCAFQIK